jgi:hypothetical protein
VLAAEKRPAVIPDGVLEVRNPSFFSLCAG